MDKGDIRFYVTLGAVLLVGLVWSCNANHRSQRENSLAQLTACASNGGSWVQGRYNMQCVQGSASHAE